MPESKALSPRRPHRLRPDNFTPASRTPWGGFRMAQYYKQALGLAEDLRLGEAWEVSVEPSFPSRLEAGPSLEMLIRSDPVAWLGSAMSSRYHERLPLLVKLLDAGENLSVQVHPQEGDPQLEADESGKPESWIILDAQAGAGIYLGFRDAITRVDVEDCICSGGAFDQLLNFVEVAPGDVFDLPAGTVHAIGQGVTLVEPQHITPGRKGVTYRFWDWNRRYDAAGQLDVRGRPRRLHLERALEVSDWDAARGAEFVESCRCRSEVLSTEPIRRERLVSNSYFESQRWQGSGELDLPVDRLLAVLCIAGSAELTGPDGQCELRLGQSAVVPAAVESLQLRAEGCELIVSSSL